MIYFVFFFNHPIIPPCLTSRETKHHLIREDLKTNSSKSKLPKTLFIIPLFNSPPYWGEIIV
jgi:hypothetical protein